MRTGEPNAQALVVVDVQRASFEGNTAVPDAERLLVAITTQVAAARAARALVVYLQNDGSSETGDAPGTDGWELALEPASRHYLLCSAVAAHRTNTTPITRFADDRWMRCTTDPPALLSARPISSDHDPTSAAIVFHALGNRDRLAILRILMAADEPMRAGKLRAVATTPAMVSHYLRLLEQAGLVTSSGRGSGTKWSAAPGSMERVANLLA